MLYIPELLYQSGLSLQLATCMAWSSMANNTAASAPFEPLRAGLYVQRGTAAAPAIGARDCPSPVGPHAPQTAPQSTTRLLLSTVTLSNLHLIQRGI